MVAYAPHQQAMKITTLDALRALYDAARERSVKKQIAFLDKHCQRIISLSPFLVLGTCGATTQMDTSPRGGAPGFVKVLNEHTLLIPDAPGNNRLDSLENIIATGRVGLLFLVPGVDETLRVNGSAVLSINEHEIDLCVDEKRRPKLAIKVTVTEAYLHCAKALMRSKLWGDEYRVDRGVLPSMGEMMRDQIGGDILAESQEEMLRRYAVDL
jgi:uncharacterized protein